MLGDKYKDSIKLWGGQNDRGYVCIVVRLNTSGMLGDIGDKYKDEASSCGKVKMKERVCLHCGAFKHLVWVGC